MSAALFLSRLPTIQKQYMVKLRNSYFKSEDERCLCDHMEAIEQYFHVVLFIVLYKMVLVYGWNPSVWPFIMSDVDVTYGTLVIGLFNDTF